MFRPFDQLDGETNCCKTVNESKRVIEGEKTNSENVIRIRCFSVFNGNKNLRKTNKEVI